VRAGGQREHVLGVVSLRPEQLDDDQQRVPSADFEQLARSALEVTGDAALGLHMGEHVNTAAFHLVGALTEHATTLRQGIEAVMRYARIFTDRVSSELREDGKTASIRFAFPRGAALGPRLSAELAVTVFSP
jgi:hypothetical protein